MLNVLLVIDSVLLLIILDLWTLNIRVFINILLACGIALPDHLAHGFATMSIFIFICIAFLVSGRLFKLISGLTNNFVSLVLQLF